MKLLIACDMEGISGVVNWDQVTPGHAEYERSRKVMTQDVNAALRGAAQAGADTIVVTDGHWNSSNILIEELDPRATLFCGTPSPFAMVDGINTGVDCAMFIGYHARAGSMNAIMDHTWSSARVLNVWVNGRLTGEIGLNGAVCGHFGVPVILVSGDQTACAEAADFLGPVDLAVVKTAIGRNSAECLPIATAQQKIRELAARATSQFRAGNGPNPFTVKTPVEVIVEFFYSDMADRAALLPDAMRLDGRRIQFIAEDMPAAYRSFRAAVTLANR